MSLAAQGEVCRRSAGVRYLADPFWITIHLQWRHSQGPQPLRPDHEQADTGVGRHGPNPGGKTEIVRFAFHFQGFRACCALSGGLVAFVLVSGGSDE